MNLRDIKIVLRAVECLYHGLDISNYTYDDLKSTYFNDKGAKVSKAVASVPDFVIKFDESAMTVLDFYTDTFKRQKAEYILPTLDLDEEGNLINPDITPNVVVNKDTLVSLIRVLFKAGVSKFTDLDEALVDEDLEARLKALREIFDRKDIQLHKDWENLSIDKLRSNFNVLVGLAYEGQDEVKKKLIETYNRPLEHFNIKNFEDYKVIDNRLFIPINEADIHELGKDFDRAKLEGMKYIVVSKNLYDYFFCSYGSEFQSCYSLNSSHSGWYGMIPFGTFDSHFIIYGTKEVPQKTSMCGKWWTPYMFFRSWGWLNENNELLVDKQYSNRLNRHDLDNIYKILGFKYKDCVDENLKEAKEMSQFFRKYSLKFYPDSIKMGCEPWKFSRDNGYKSFIGNTSYSDDRNLIDRIHNLSEVSSTYDPLKDSLIINNRLFNPKKCPITNLMIDESESQHYYAKLFKENVGKFLVITYVDGNVAETAQSESSYGGEGSIKTSRFNRRDFDTEFNGSCLWLGKENTYININTPLPKLKEFIKGHMNDSYFDTVLLRILEDSGTTFIKYRKKEQH